MTPHNNAISQRLEVLQSHYYTFYNDESARILLWLIEADEYAMIEKFMDVESSIDGSSPDLFIKFGSPFTSAPTYGSSLTAELNALVEYYKEETGDKGVAIDWRLNVDEFSEEEQKTSKIFTRNLSAFGNSLEDLETNVLAFLAPSEIKKFSKMENWLLQAIQEGIPDNVRFMLVDFIENPVFNKLPDTPGVMAVTANLDMTSAMKELASSAGSDNPGTHFQMIFIDLSKAASKKEMEKVEKYANQAMEIAVAQGWLHLQVAVHMTVGSAWMQQKNYEKTLKSFDAAIRLGENSQKLKEPIAGKLLSNALFAKAAVFVSMSNFEDAVSIYESIVPVTVEDKDHYMSMEAWRMAGFCNERIDALDKSYVNYQNALEAAEQLEKEMLQDSSLHYAGSALLKINDQLYGDLEKEEWIEEKMNTLLGEDWKTNSRKKQN
jgi:tetratricopeptide (TPR) repeat protein